MKKVVIITPKPRLIVVLLVALNLILTASLAYTINYNHHLKIRNENQYNTIVELKGGK